MDHRRRVEGQQLADDETCWETGDLSNFSVASATLSRQ
uniref:Uncharacterized protein n=1 Tax=Rhizobium rhizogenes TaxID=359 RepID=A0A7S5DSB4_RHIRH|nr:hypothetical protein pC6.5d_707 [Rhizobium rhizogenes]